jgi:hypothetical protein
VTLEKVAAGDADGRNRTKRMRKSPKQSAKTKSSPVTLARSIDVRVSNRLYGASAGRCQFKGCNKDVTTHSLTRQPAALGEKAHIVAFKKDGPRGRQGTRPADVHDITNLMLLCRECHRLIDTRPQEYPRELLEGFKREHEERVRRATEIGPERRTATLLFQAPIRGQRVVVSEDQAVSALHEQHRYPADKAAIIDLNGLIGAAEDETFTAQACGQIDRTVDRLFASGGDLEAVGHLAVFAIGPIPLLAHLGSRLSSKVPAALFQRHRDSENWTWKSDGPAVSYKVECIQNRGRSSPVALVLALSGTVTVDTLPQEVQAGSNVYRITLDGAVPNPTFLRRLQDLDGFKNALFEALGTISHEHGLVQEIDLFPAVPAPVAVLCGRERLPKVHPRFRVYDYDAAAGGFNYKLTVQ